MRFIFFGSSKFAEIILSKLLEFDMKPILVVTTPAKEKGRKKILSPTPVYSLAEQNNISILTPKNLKDEKFLLIFKNYNPDLVILTAYGKIIPSELLSIPKKGVLNLHPSLLPKWRGATPIQSAILTGDKETGVSLFLMDEQVDHGSIIQRTKYEIQNPSITYPELSQKLAEIGADLIIKIVPKWIKGEIDSISQDHSLASYCHKILPEDEKIDWNKSNVEIDRKIRAFNPNPGTFTKATKENGTIIKIIKGYSLNDLAMHQKKALGQVFEFENKLAVKCGIGIYIIEELKPAGKNTMTSESFLRGNQWILKTNF